jgi:hypothetical protein
VLVVIVVTIVVAIVVIVVPIVVLVVLVVPIVVLVVIVVPIVVKRHVGFRQHGVRPKREEVPGGLCRGAEA